MAPALSILETYNTSLILRAALPILMVGPAAQHCLMQVGVHVITSPRHPMALLGVPMVYAGKLPALAVREQVAQALGHDWYLVDETQCREAFGDTSLPSVAPDPVLWPAPRFDEAPRAVNYFEDTD